MPTAGNRIHIVDTDTRRRAKIAYGLSSSHYVPQIYENVEELLDYPPDEGLLLLNDDVGHDRIAHVTRAIAARSSHVPIAIFGERPSTGTIVDAMLAGAIDYLEWPFDSSRLDETIAKAEGDASSHLKALQRQRQAQARVELLTGREQDVLRLLIKGYGNKDIAKALDISPRTVEVHRANMLEKLNARSSSEAIRLGIYAGLDD